MKKCNTVEELQEAALKIRQNLLKLCHKENIHIGGDLSITDVMTVLWQYQMNYYPNDIHNENRDRFILSKGHASAVTSFNQAAIGCFSSDDVINEYATDGGRFSMHSCNLVNPYVEVSTGSLGHGFPIACGIAQALRLKNNTTSRVYVVMGDGEQCEGSIWEAATNAAKQRLGNLVSMVDNNGLEADGALKDVAGISSLADRYRVCGWNVVELNGNDIVEIKNAFDNLPAATSSIPTVFICHTTKGKGVSFMENQARWHAGKLDDEQYKKAVESLQNEYGVESIKK
ncbi:MAG: transketolase [Lachnospiraceae bacterium]|uniref:Transketolase n=1 Tax=Candidatus Weimeria bifida TaxID=2599074 RepID=A0A6N7J1F7_9FIRM|nr:transketolase [Candidatus Weimeria bifida]RRF95987.1 MAG: transketolase [Lachnospiraceae bacterium]